MTAITQVLKHLPGQHEQLTHGHRGVNFISRHPLGGEETHELSGSEKTIIEDSIDNVRKTIPALENIPVNIVPTSAGINSEEWGRSSNLKGTRYIFINTEKIKKQKVDSALQEWTGSTIQNNNDLLVHVVRHELGHLYWRTQSKPSDKLIKLSSGNKAIVETNSVLNDWRNNIFPKNQEKMSGFSRYLHSYQEGFADAFSAYIGGENMPAEIEDWFLNNLSGTETKEFKDWDYSGYPPELRLLLELLGGDIDELFLSLLAGELGLLPWQTEMELLLGRYHLATFLKGAGLKKVSETQMKYIMNVLAEQFEYLDNFTKTMIADIKALLALPEKERPPLKTVLEKYKTRAGMYGRSVTQEYWTGITGGVPLPAMPGDLTSQCGINDRCRWEITPINAENGDFNAFWILDEAPDIQHCQTCQVRAADWNPLRIREWTYRLPSQRVLTEQLAGEVAEAGVGAEVKSRRKHLPGQHP